jgi:hypothetical protein
MVNTNKNNKMNYKFIKCWSDFILNETLKSYDIDFVLDHISHEIALTLPDLDFVLEKQDNKLILILNVFNIIDKTVLFFKFLNSLFIDRNGWFPSAMTLKNIQNKNNILKYYERYLYSIC